MMSAEELRSRCAATLRKWYGHHGAPHAGMDGESLLEALLGSGRRIEVVDDPAERVWIWSDLHLWDDMAQRLWRRPEANARAMSDRMLDEWERTVGADDLMLCLGDVAHPYGLVDPKLAARLRAAPGRRLLVLGNHDVDPVNQVRPVAVGRTAATLFAPGDPPLLLTHVPLLQVPYGWVNVHGHVHQKESPTRNRHINVSVEQLNYRPARLSDIRRLARRLLEGRIVPGHSTRARLNVVERVMP